MFDHIPLLAVLWTAMRFARAVQVEPPAVGAFWSRLYQRLGPGHLFCTILILQETSLLMVEGKVQIVLPGRKVVDERAPRPRNLLEFVSSWYGLYRDRFWIILCAMEPASYASCTTSSRDINPRIGRRSPQCPDLSSEKKETNTGHTKSR